MKKILIVLIALLFLSLFAYVQKPSFTPNEVGQQANEVGPKRIIGFLPYWQVGTVSESKLKVLTDVFFFGVHFDEKGALAANDIKRLDGVSFTTLVLILQENEKIEQFLADQKAWDTFVEEVVPLIDTYTLEGINIDVEYSGIPAKITINGFTEFMSYMTRRLKETNPSVVISVDTTADSIRKSRLYDVENIAKEVDYIILMGYDFYRPGSSVAGPIAPLFGKEIYDYDVSSAIEDFLKVVPKEKLILGVAYYGWDFPTASDERGSFTEERPDESVALATYKRTRKLLEEGKVTAHFDEDSQTPWMTYKDETSGDVRQIWFEDAISLGKKYDFINEKRLAGVAIWALGYDGDYPQLNSLLEEKFPR